MAQNTDNAKNRNEKVAQYFSLSARERQNKAQLRKEVAAELTKDIVSLAEEISQIRKGYKDAQGNEHRPKILRYSQAIEHAWGAKSIYDVLGTFGVSRHDTLTDLAFNVTGKTNGISPQGFLDLLSNYTKLDFSSASTSNYAPPVLQFLLPELVMEVIDTQYKGGSKHKNWIAYEAPATRDIILPYFEGSMGVPTFVAEGGDAPMGRIKMSEKTINTKESKGGFEISDKLLRGTSILNLSTAIGKVGFEMGLIEDIAAVEVLVNGEANYPAESMSVIGVKSANTLTMRDLIYPFAVLAELGFSPNTMIAPSSTWADIHELDYWKGFSGETRPVNSKRIIPAELTEDSYPVGGNKVIVFDKSKTLMKATGTQMFIEQDRDIRKGGTFAVATQDYAFGKLDAAAGLLVDVSLALSGNDIPDSMNLGAYIAKRRAILNM